MKTAHEELNKVFTEHGISLYSDPDDIFNLFYDEDIRQDFTEAFAKFSKAMDNVFPRKEALEYLRDLNRFAEINTLASQHLLDRRMSMKGVSVKLRKVTDEFLKSKGITTKIEPISILDDKFFENVRATKRKETKAAKIEHAIREVINISMDEDPELYASFAEELRNILLAFKENWEEIYRLLEALRNKIKSAQQEDTKGLDRKRQMPIPDAPLNYDKTLALREPNSKEPINYNLEIVLGNEMPELSIIDYLMWAVQRNLLKGESQ